MINIFPDELIELKLMMIIKMLFQDLFDLMNFYSWFQPNLETMIQGDIL